MKTIKINYCDFYSSFDKNNNDFTNVLKKHYHVEISDTPDVVFYSVFGKDHLNYDCVRVFYTGELQSPDFNICDYAIGFDSISFGDRYLRFPFYKLDPYTKKYTMRNTNPSDTLFDRAFCSFVCSNDQGMNERKEMFNLLMRYKPVASGGGILIM